MMKKKKKMIVGKINFLDQDSFEESEFNEYDNNTGVGRTSGEKDDTRSGGTGTVSFAGGGLGINTNIDNDDADFDFSNGISPKSEDKLLNNANPESGLRNRPVTASKSLRRSSIHKSEKKLLPDNCNDIMKLMKEKQGSSSIHDEKASTTNNNDNSGLKKNNDNINDSKIEARERRLMFDEDYFNTMEGEKRLKEQECRLEVELIEMQRIYQIERDDLEKKLKGEHQENRELFLQKHGGKEGKHEMEFNKRINDLTESRKSVIQNRMKKEEELNNNNNNNNNDDKNNDNKNIEQQENVEKQNQNYHKELQLLKQEEEQHTIDLQKAMDEKERNQMKLNEEKEKWLQWEAELIAKEKESIQLHKEKMLKIQSSHKIRFGELQRMKTQLKMEKQEVEDFKRQTIMEKKQMERQIRIEQRASAILKKEKSVGFSKFFNNNNNNVNSSSSTIQENSKKQADIPVLTEELQKKVDKINYMQVREVQVEQKKLMKEKRAYNIKKSNWNQIFTEKHKRPATKKDYNGEIFTIEAQLKELTFISEALHQRHVKLAQTAWGKVEDNLEADALNAQQLVEIEEKCIKEAQDLLEQVVRKGKAVEKITKLTDLKREKNKCIKAKRRLKIALKEWQSEFTTKKKRAPEYEDEKRISKISIILIEIEDRAENLNRKECELKGIPYVAPEKKEDHHHYHNSHHHEEHEKDEKKEEKVEEENFEIFETSNNINTNDDFFTDETKIEEKEKISDFNNLKIDVNAADNTKESNTATPLAPSGSPKMRPGTTSGSRKRPSTTASKRDESEEKVKLESEHVTDIYQEKSKNSIKSTTQTNTDEFSFDIDLPGWKECMNTNLPSTAHAAAYHGHYEVLEYLARFFDIFTVDDKGRTPLFYACVRDQLACVAFLISIDSSWLDVGDTRGDTALHAAIASNASRVIKFLLDSEASTNVSNNAGLTPAHIAVSVEALTLLKDHGADFHLVDEKSRMPIWTKSAEGNKECTQFLCENMVNEYICWPDIDGNTPMHAAAEKGQAGCLAILCDFNSDWAVINAFNNKNYTPAHQSSSQPVFKTLYEYGADIFIKNNLERTPLFTSAGRGRIACVAFLLEVSKNSHPDIADEADAHGDTPLHVAALAGFYPVVELICQSMLNPLVKNKRGLTAAELAVQVGKQPIADLILSYNITNDETQKTDHVSWETIASVVQWYGARWGRELDPESGYKYFYDRATGVSQWEMPENYDGEPVTDNEEEYEDPIDQYDHDEYEEEEEVILTPEEIAENERLENERLEVERLQQEKDERKLAKRKRRNEEVIAILMDFFEQNNASRTQDVHRIVEERAPDYEKLFVQIENKYNMEIRRPGFMKLKK